MSKEAVSVLSRLSVSRFIRSAFFVSVVFVALYFTAKLAMRFFPFPVCGFRWLTGLPCPFCGGTRCLAFFASGHWLKAFLVNPLIFFTCVLFLFSAIFRIIACRSCSLFERWKPSASVIVVMLILVHWLYLIWASARGWF